MNAGVCIGAPDRAGLERLLRYCARPPFALDRLRQRGAELVYYCPKPQSGGKQADLVLTPLELIERIAALVPPRTHRHPSHPSVSRRTTSGRRSSRASTRLFRWCAPCVWRQHAPDRVHPVKVEAVG